MSPLVRTIDGNVSEPHFAMLGRAHFAGSDSNGFFGHHYQHGDEYYHKCPALNKLLKLGELATWGRYWKKKSEKLMKPREKRQTYSQDGDKVEDSDDFFENWENWDWMW